MKKRTATNLQQSKPDTDNIPYPVRRSSRARYMRINVRKDTGIEIVIPEHTALKHIEPFIHKHRHWIEEQIQQLGLDKPVHPPQTIALRAIEETWHINYQYGHGKTWRALEHGNNQLTIRGPEANTGTCIHTLNRWLRKQAQRFLPDRLYDLSQHCKLPYKKVTIRSQRSRWGSCSSTGSINLNDRLMLLPCQQVEYVLIHELCHTRHPNHSKQFWSLVASFSPDYQQLDRQIRQAQKELPDWV